jgi:hypothetical protein
MSFLTDSFWRNGSFLAQSYDSQKFDLFITLFNKVKNVASDALKRSESAETVASEARKSC